MDLLLLHGALGAAGQFKTLISRLGGSGIHTLDFEGHGGTPLPREPFTIRRFAEQTLKWMDGRGIARADFLGYSMGGYVALYIARHHPERVSKVFTLSTKFLWTPEIAERERRNLDPELIQRKAPEFGKALSERHGEPGWKQLVEKTGEMITLIAADNPLKPADYAKITCPVLVSVGDGDKMVSLEETLDVFRFLANAQFMVLPGTGHPLEAIDADLVAFHAKRFLG